MSAQPWPSFLNSVRPRRRGHPHRKPDMTTEPERDIDRTSTEGMVRRLLEPSVDRAEEKEYKRCAFHALCNGANSGAVNPIRYVDQYQALLTRRDSHIDEADLYEADLSFYRANLQICEAVSADGPVDRPEPQSPVDDRQRTAEDVYAAYVLQPERIVRMRGNSRAGSIGDQYGRWLNGVPFERMRPNRAATLEIGN